MIVKKPYGIALLVIFCAQAFGAASSTRTTPHLGTSPEEHQQYEGLIAALRRNDAEHVRDTLGKNPAILEMKADGGITPLHVAVAMEYVHGHDPKEVIDAFAQTASHLDIKPIASESNLYYDSIIHDPTKNRQLQSLAHIKANINHPTFHALCTGETASPIEIKLALTPLELAARHGSIRTLAALVRHMSISDVILKEPALGDNIELYRAIVEHERTRAIFTYESFAPYSVTIDPYLSNKLERHIVKTFGAQGMQLLHDFNIDLARGKLQDGRPCSAFQMFEQYYPGKADEVSHLRPAAESWIHTIASFFSFKGREATAPARL